jgi:hypothetical protein
MSRLNKINIVLKRHILYLLILSLSSIGLQGQKAFHAYGFGGFLMPHRQYMLNMESNIGGLDLSIHYQGSGNKYIDSIAGAVEWGVSLYAASLGDKDLVGNVIAINPYLQFLLAQRKKNFTYLKIGTGLGYITKTFDPVTNPYNRAISNRINASMYLHLLNEYKFSERYSLLWGIGLTHFSNGNYSKPNLGINMPQLNLGISFNNPSKPYKGVYEFVPVLNYLEIRAAWGTKQATVSDPIRRSVNDFALTYGMGKSPIRSWRFGLDFFYDRLNPYKPFDPSTLKGNDFKDIAELGIRFGHEYYFGKVSMIFDVGYYLYKPPDAGKMPSYFCLAINYHVANFNFGPRLKTHLGVADYLGLGIAYRFNLKKKHE